MRPDRRPTSGVLWEVIAPWVRWPLHSPRRLFSVLAGLVLAAVAWHALTGAPSGIAASTGGSPGTASTGASGPRPAGPSSGATGDPMSPGTASVPPPTTSGSAPSAARAGGADASASAPTVPPGSDAAARGFVAAWARPGLPADQWLAGVRGYVTPQLEQAMSYTDPTTVPATTVTGPPRMVHVQPDASGASFEVPTDAGAVRVDLALLESRWLVSDFVPASATQPGD